MMSGLVHAHEYLDLVVEALLIIYQELKHARTRRNLLSASVCYYVELPTATAVRLRLD